MGGITLSNMEKTAMSSKGKDKETSTGYYVGIDAGSVSINCVVIDQDRDIIYESPYKRHLGKVEEEVLGLIRSLGMEPGWSTHRPETIVVSDRAGYDIAAYIQPYNSIGFLCAVETDWVARVINNTPKPVICIKPLGAGRILPPTGLSFVYNSIKPIDTVCIGVLSPQETEEDVKIALSIMEKQAINVELQYTRSKQVLAKQK